MTKQCLFFKITTLILAGTAAICSQLNAQTIPTPTTPTTPTAQKKPNIIILYADDFGFGDLSCYHPEGKIHTPHLDALASQGMRFTNAHSSSGICTPSRYALLTGRYHWRDFHSIVLPMGPSVIPSDRLTLPEMLRNHGYTTAAIGKWHLGWDWNNLLKKQNPATKKKSAHAGKPQSPSAYDWSRAIPDGPTAHGFDYYWGEDVINFPPYTWIENDKVVKAPDTMVDTSRWKKIKEGHWECRPGPACSDWDPYQIMPTNTRKAVEYISKHAHGKKPFFLYMAFTGVHAPIIPNDKFDGTSKAGAYGDFVVETDDACGQIIATLKKNGILDNTIVIFSADNGPEYYAYERDRKYHHWSSFPLRGVKRDIYEGGHRVPMIIRYPKLVQADQVSHALVSQIDLMATLADITGAKIPKHHGAEDSQSMLPVLTGANQQGRNALVHNTVKNRYAIRSGKWLLIDTVNGYVTHRNKAWEKRHHYTADDDLPVELYDLSKDIGQHHNLAATFPETVKNLQLLLKKIRNQEGPN